MSIKHSEASKARWAKRSKADRTKRMKAAAVARWAKPKNQDPKKRRLLAMQMVRARAKKK